MPNLLDRLITGYALRITTRLSGWFIATAGGSDRPAFFDIDKVCPALRDIDRAYPEISAEVMTILNDRQRIPLLHETDVTQACISSATPYDWRVFYLSLMGCKEKQNRARCPATSAVTDRIPGIFQACFSILDPGKSIPLHNGPYGGYLRYHLALIVPAAKPPQLRVRGEPYTWREGESVLFDDSHDHEVINSSDGPRVVLIVDIPRPMPLPQALANRFGRVLGGVMYGKPTLERATAGATS
jgi:aspartyl/asparaginyl beta-hydroxylase (cupin superfamily)